MPHGAPRQRKRALYTQGVVLAAALLIVAVSAAAAALNLPAR